LRLQRLDTEKGGTALKVSKHRLAANREALVQAASRLFRERGVEGVGVAEICREAGLTHGALYAQFPSKEALAAEALADGLARVNALMTAPRDGYEPSLGEYLDFYLSRQHRDNLGAGCAMAASASEIARHGEEVSARFVEGFDVLVGAVERALVTTEGATERRQRAQALVAAMVGGVAAARATARADPTLSDEILVAVRRVLGELGGEGRPG